MKRLGYCILLVSILVLLIPVPGFASGIQDDRVVFGGVYRLESGEVLDGDLAVFGGVAFLAEESRVVGSVLVLGGNLDVYGQIDGDIIILGGNVNLGGTAVILGDIASLGANVNNQGARIEGGFVEGDNVSFPVDFDDFDFDFFRWTRIPFRSMRMSFEAQVLGYLFVSFALAAVAVLAGLLIPEPTARVAKAVMDQPAAAGGLGLLTLFVVPPLLILLAITICLFPVSLLGFFVLALAWVFGIIALGYEVGIRLAKATHQEFQPIMAAGLGTLVLSLVVGGIGFIPCLGALVSLLVGIFGLGAVLLTRFGTRTYPNGDMRFEQEAHGEIATSTPAEEKALVEGAQDSENGDLGEDG